MKRVITKFEPWACKKCGLVMDEAEYLFDNTVVPVEGDFSLCINCCELYVLTFGKWRLATQMERIHMPPEVRDEQRRLMAAHKTAITEDLALSQKLRDL